MTYDFTCAEKVVDVGIVDNSYKASAEVVLIERGLTAFEHKVFYTVQILCNSLYVQYPYSAAIVAEPVFLRYLLIVIVERGILKYKILGTM